MYSNRTSFDKSKEEEILGDFGGQYMPYQPEPVVSSADNSGEENGEGQVDGMDADDNPEDEDGLRPSVLGDCFDGNIPLDEWK